jgi:hypothetical protein
MMSGRGVPEGSVARGCVALVAGFALLVAAAPASAAAGSAPIQAPVAGDLFVITAGGGKLERVPGRSRVFELVLRRPARDVTMFTDRPARQAGERPLGRFVRGWARLGFGRVPPNAALVVADAPSDRDVLALELSRPRLGAGGRTLAFRVEVLRGSPKGVLRKFGRKADRRVADRFGRVSLFIDPSGQTVALSFALIGVPANAVVAIAFDNAEVDLAGAAVEVVPMGSTSLANFVLASNSFSLTPTTSFGVNARVSLGLDVAAATQTITGTASIPAGMLLPVSVTVASTGNTSDLPNGRFSIGVG